MTEPIDRFDRLVAELTLEEKVSLLTGADFWTTVGIPRIGLRPMVLSDGPSGVRGPVWDERSPSLNLPSASALSSSWDVGRAREFGRVSAQEARRKGVDIVLGPTINLHRSPYGGRHFEAFSEDPVLTAELAAAYVAGVQEQGVAATPKHYIANDFETERMTADVIVDERTLREVYLAAFERAITESHAWLVMSAYNSINGTTASEHELLESPLNSEWGFDGVVVSDWTAVRSLDAARASQDLAMPGPFGAWGAALVEAVRAGEIAESAIDRKVRRLLVLASRVGALDGFDAVAPTEQDGVAFARDAAIAGTVLVKNDTLLPTPLAGRRVAVIGHNARDSRTQGGGSATVVPERVVSILDGVAAAGADVAFSLGAVVQKGVGGLPLATMTNPATGEPGLRVRFLDEAGGELFVDDRFDSHLVWFGGDAPVTTAHAIELTTRFTPPETGTVLIGFAAVGHGTITADGVMVVDETVEPDSDDIAAALLAPPSIARPLAVTAGTPVSLTFVYDVTTNPGAMVGVVGLTLGIEPDDSAPDALIAEAVESARTADLAIVVVGTNSAVESEGFDRTSLALPGRQDDLVRAVAAVNSNTVVVVNSGSPVLLPWRDEVAAVLIGYFGGQEMGAAIAAIIEGSAEPGGRLPTTWPALEADLPVSDVTPVDGQLAYAEGIHIGYRAWLRAGTTPAYAFGHGLGYTTWELAVTDASAESIEVAVRNTGARAGATVVQVYASRPGSTLDRPVRWLVGFATARAEAGDTATTRISLPRRAFEHWADGWQLEPGDFTIHVGFSVDDLPASTTITVVD